jgi:hypothetical protein
VKVSHCSSCGTRIFAGELVGVEEDRVLCCMCLDAGNAKLEIVRNVEDDNGSEDEEASSPPPPDNG